MTTVSNVLMINAATSAAVSSNYTNNNCDILGIQVTGTFSSATLYIQGMVNTDSNTWVNLAALNLTDFDVENAGITSAGLYEYGIEGVMMVRANVSAVSGGNITVYGKFASSANN